MTDSAHDLIKTGIIDGRKHVREPRLRAIRAYRTTERLNETGEGSALVMYERPTL
jgi:hypothetical protein